MAMSTGIIPQSLSLSLVTTKSTPVDNVFVFKAIPRDYAGAAIDLTDATGAVMLVNNQSVNLETPTSITLTLGTHDETGAILTIPAADLATIFETFGTSPCKFTVMIADIVGDYLCAYGNLSISFSG